MLKVMIITLVMRILRSKRSVCVYFNKYIYIIYKKYFLRVSYILTICISLLITTACILLISNNIPQQFMVSLMCHTFHNTVHTHVHTNFHTPHLYKYAPHYYDFCYISMLKPYHCLKYSRCTCREICLLFTTFRLHIISKIIIKCMFSNIFCINFKYGSTNIFHWKWKEII